MNSAERLQHALHDVLCGCPLQPLESFGCEYIKFSTEDAAAVLRSLSVAGVGVSNASPSRAQRFMVATALQSAIHAVLCTCDDLEAYGCPNMEFSVGGEASDVYDALFKRELRLAAA